MFILCFHFDFCRYYFQFTSLRLTSTIVVCGISFNDADSALRRVELSDMYLLEWRTSSARGMPLPGTKAALGASQRVQRACDDRDDRGCEPANVHEVHKVHRAARRSRGGTMQRMWMEWRVQRRYSRRRAIIDVCKARLSHSEQSI